jgi:serine/threonine protein kinase
MRTVFRARDTRLGRDVALKLRPESFKHDPDRIARFRREAQVLASLNQPNIGAIYGLEESGVRRRSSSSSWTARRSRGKVPRWQRIQFRNVVVPNDLLFVANSR